MLQISRIEQHYRFAYECVNGEIGEKSFWQTFIGETFKGHSEYKRIKFCGIKIIDKGAFDGCTELVELHIPRSVEFIHPEAFSNCPKLSRVVFEKGILEIEMAMNAQCSVEMSLFPPFKDFLDALTKSRGARLITSDNPSDNNWE